MAVFTGNVDISILPLWNRVNLALIMHCLPSQIGNESNRDIQTIKVILSAQDDMKELENEKGVI